jgi:hypothetical protein
MQPSVRQMILTGCARAGQHSPNLSPRLLMDVIKPNPFLRRVLLADAAASIAVAVVQIAATSVLASLLNLPSYLLTGTGAFLVGYVVLLLALSRAQTVFTSLLTLVIVGNLAWGLGCLVVAQAISPSPSILGNAYLLVQALVVWVFAALEWKGLRSSQTSPQLTSA